jgi:hypothetical protein
MRKVLAVAATALVAVGMSATPASAKMASHGAYTQVTGSLSCLGQVQDDGDGGTLFVEVAGYETRPSDKHFRTWDVRTRIMAQERTYNGSWKTVAVGPVVHGRLGPSYSDDNGTVNVSDINWGGDYSPTLSIDVAGFDDLFRARVQTRIYDDEGARIANLNTYQGQCRV